MQRHSCSRTPKWPLVAAPGSGPHQGLLISACLSLPLSLQIHLSTPDLAFSFFSSHPSFPSPCHTSVPRNGIGGRCLHVFLPGCHGGQCGWGWRQHSLLDKLFSQWLLGPSSPGYPPSGLTFLFHFPCFISISLASKKFSTFKTHLGNVLLVSCNTLNVGGT